MNESSEAAWGSIQYALTNRPQAQAEALNRLIAAYGAAKAAEESARWAEVAHDLDAALRWLLECRDGDLATDVREWDAVWEKARAALAAYRALAGEASDEVEEERCSCWFHEGTRRGSTEDDPCPVHPDDLVIVDDD